MRRAALAIACLTVLVGACSRPAEREAPRATAAAPGSRRISVFFPRADSCEVHPFPREVPDGDSLAVVRAALLALLAGPTAEEAAAGFRSALPDTLEILRHRMRYVTFGYDPPHAGKRVEIRSLEPQSGGVLRVDFSRELGAYDRGAVRVCAIVRQVQETVRQFEEWKAVRIAIEGKTEGILQP